MHVEFILDRSGSMWSIAAQAVEGFNGFLLEQKAVDDSSSFGVVQFDNKYQRTFYDDIKDAEELHLGSTYRPRGSTALLDAIGRTIKGLGSQKDVILNIFTDGQENASSEFTREDIKKLVANRRKRGWQINFLSNDITAAKDAAFMYGIHDTVHINSDYVGASFNEAINSSTSNYRKGIRGLEASVCNFVDTNQAVKIDTND